MKIENKFLCFILVIYAIVEVVTFNGFNPIFTKFIFLNKSLNLIDTRKSVLENMYFASGIVITFTLLLGIYSLREDKRTNKFAKKRTELMVTYDICEKYTYNIIPLIDDYLEKYSKSSMHDSLTEFGSKFNSNSKFENIPSKQEFITQQLTKYGLSSNYYNDTLNLLNKLEIIALVFDAEMANIEISKKIIGESYIDIVSHARPVITLERIFDKTDYDLIVSLYERISEKYF